MGYKVIPTETCKDELDDVLRYLVKELGAMSGARSLYDAIQNAKTTLADNPELKAVSTKPILE